MRQARLWMWIALATVATSCSIGTVAVESVAPDAAQGTTVRSPLKAFLVDGTIAVFPEGARVTADSVLGRGSHYSLLLEAELPIRGLALDSIVGLEAFRNDHNTAASILASTAAVAVGGIAAVAVFKAIFGSCPTIYSYQDGVEILEAEAFSYSIAPLLEGRDVDRLSAQPGRDGSLTLELRNEALETHYINHLELLEVSHDPGQEAYPNELGRIVKVRDLLPPQAATDRSGRARLDELRQRDGLAFASTDDRIRAVTADDFTDHVDLTFPRPEGETAALVLRLRNSLLNTVLFYDMMLGARGAAALDWLGEGMNRIGEAVELGSWFQQVMGLRVSVLGPDGWIPVTRVADTGPIAWEELAVQLPVPDTRELRVRLTFLADEWRIDYAALANEVELADDVHVVPLRSINRPGAPPDDRTRQELADPDEDYLITTAGTAYVLQFGATSRSDGVERSYFLSSQGYYTEWIRPEWIGGADPSRAFRPTPDAVVALMSRWLDEKGEYERRFFETRIPVR